VELSSTRIANCLPDTSVNNTRMEVMTVKDAISETKIFFANFSLVIVIITKATIKPTTTKYSELKLFNNAFIFLFTTFR
jgi:hypothetical protein